MAAREEGIGNSHPPRTKGGPRLLDQFFLTSEELTPRREVGGLSLKFSEMPFLEVATSGHCDPAQS